MASGGKRIGSGRKSTGRKVGSFYVTDNEAEFLRDMLSAVRSKIRYLGTIDLEVVRNVRN